LQSRKTLQEPERLANHALACTANYPRWLNQ
jgi:hypothetical protein